MKTALLLILPFMVLSCRQPAMPTFADRCKHELLPGDQGNVQLALDGRVQIATPGSRCPLPRNEYGFVVGDTSLGYANAIAFTESSFNGNWDWDDEIAYLMRNLTDNPHVRMLSSGIGTDQCAATHSVLLPPLRAVPRLCSPRVQSRNRQYWRTPSSRWPLHPRPRSN